MVNILKNLEINCVCLHIRTQVRAIEYCVFSKYSNSGLTDERTELYVMANASHNNCG